jgi:hypothetical protein
VGRSRLDHLADVYARFAAGDAYGRSALYGELATGVAGDREILHVLAQLPAKGAFTGALHHHRLEQLVSSKTREGSSAWPHWS